MEKGKKKVKKTTVKYKTAEQDEIVKFFVVVLVVLLCVGAIYLLTRAFVTKDLFNKDESKVEEVISGEINYEVAIMGQILNRPYKEYYVAIYNQEEGDYIADMANLVYKYGKKEKHKHIYTVNLANKLNADYYDPEKVNTKAQKLEDIKVGDITLIKVKNGKIVKYLVDLSKMEKELGVE